MKTYTFLAHYRNECYLSQYQALDLSDALHLWGSGLDKKIFTPSRRKRIMVDIENMDYFPLPINHVENVWRSCYLSDKSFLILEIVETA